uniref:Uncharacterized protein n=1 Tax=Panagrolaimus sp. ES5 TaxID=591445 RepID=A0AC34F0P4_9BILA
MATISFNSSLGDDKNSSSFYQNDKFNNLNLNATSKHPKSDSYHSKNESNGSNLRQNGYEQNQKQQKQNDKTPLHNSSTLSLHIAAYENIVEDVKEDFVQASEDKPKTIKFVTTWKNANGLFSDPQPMNPFEFPRQGEDKSNTPEVMQFKTSQKLSNPNKSSDANSAANGGGENATETTPESLIGKLKEVAASMTEGPTRKHITSAADFLSGSFSKIRELNAAMTEGKSQDFSVFVKFLKELIDKIREFFDLIRAEESSEDVAPIAECFKGFLDKLVKIAVPIEKGNFQEIITTITKCSTEFIAELQTIAERTTQSQTPESAKQESENTSESNPASKGTPSDETKVAAEKPSNETPEVPKSGETKVAAEKPSNETPEVPKSDETKVAAEKPKIEVAVGVPATEDPNTKVTIEISTGAPKSDEAAAEKAAKATSEAETPKASESEEAKATPEA